MYKNFFCVAVILTTLILCQHVRADSETAKQSSSKQFQKIDDPNQIAKQKVADAKVIATVGDTKITAKDKSRLNGLIFGSLLKQFAEENKIEPTTKELDAFDAKLEEMKKQDMLRRKNDKKKLVAELKSTDLSEKERKKKGDRLARIERTLKNFRKMQETSKEMQEMFRKQRRQVAQNLVNRWKVNKALYKKYGGRVIFQQAGPEPLDAYRDFLTEQEKKGAFKIIDKKYEAGFWKYFTDEKMHTFYSKDKGKKFIDTPWWLIKK